MKDELAQAYRSRNAVPALQLAERLLLSADPGPEQCHSKTGTLVQIGAVNATEKAESSWAILGEECRIVPPSTMAVGIHSMLPQDACVGLSLLSVKA